jgi:serine/threonine protein kinase
MPASAATCPTQEELAAWALGHLSAERSASVESHLDHCPTCQYQAAQLDGLADSLVHRVRGLKQGAPPQEPGLEDLLARIGPALTPPVSDGSQITRDEALAVPGWLRHYELLGKLGAGGTGIVYQGRDTNLNRDVAIKVLLDNSQGKESHLARFKREWQAAARLDHPNIVRVFEGGDEGGRPYLVMEYLEGRDLFQLVRKQGPLPILEACDCVRQAALALQHAHDHGLVHRDVKPSNLLRTARGLVKLLDLGLARWHQPATPLTEAGRVVGTLDYMAPEQFDDPQQVMAPADLYGLGCTFYFLLTGRVPFPGGNILQKMKAHQTHVPKPLVELRPDCPKELITMVNRLMEKSPAGRYPSARVLADELERYRAAAAARRWPRPTVDLPAPTRPRSTFPVGARVVLGISVVLVLLVLIGGAAFLLSQGTEPVKTPQGAPGALDVAKDGKQDPLKDLGAKTRDDEVIAELGTMSGMNSAPAAIRFSANGQFAITHIGHQGGASEVRLWDLKKKTQIKEAPMKSWTKASVIAGPVCYYGSDKTFAGSTVAVWDPVSDKTQDSPIKHEKHISWFALNPKGGQVASGDHGGTIKIWETMTAKVLQQFTHGTTIHHAIFSQDGKFLLTGSNERNAQVWNVKEDRQEKSYEFEIDKDKDKCSVTPVGISADGKRVLALANFWKNGWAPRWATIQVWDQATGKIVRKIDIIKEKPETAVAAFTPDGHRALTGHNDGTIKWWDLETGKELFSIAKHKGAVARTRPCACGTCRNGNDPARHLRRRSKNQSCNSGPVAPWCAACFLHKAHAGASVASIALNLLLIYNAGSLRR